MMGELVMSLGWAVFSFLWQGIVIGALCAAALRLVPRSASGARYAITGGGLALAFFVFCTTALLSAPNTAESRSLDDLIASAGSLQGELAAALMLVPSAPRVEATSQGWVLVVACLWAIGALWMALRLTLACGAAHRLKRRSRIAVDEHVRALTNRLCVDLGIRRRVRVFATEMADSPLVVGWLRPVVLIPTSTFLVLSAEQLRSVLAHELAHIRRFDPLFNALQAVAEVLLFFHPVTWWLSSIIRQEREHCCDLAAVRATGGPLPLARALTRLESQRQSSSEMVLAARPKPGFLMTRIQRILDGGSGASTKRAGLRPLTLFGTVAMALGLGIASAAANPQPEPAATTLSLEGRDAHADYAIVEARILEAVEARTLSADDAKNVLGALRKSMFRGEHATTRRGRLLPTVVGTERPSRDPRPRERYNEAREKMEKLRVQLREAEQAGELTSAEVAEKRAALEQRIREYQLRVDPGRARNPVLNSGVPLIGELFDRRDEVMKRLKESVASGEVSHKEAMDKLEAIYRAAQTNQREIVEGQLRREPLLEGFRFIPDPNKQSGQQDPPVVIGRRLPPDQPKREYRKVEVDESLRLKDRLRALEFELQRVQEQANRASQEMNRRENVRRGAERGEKRDPRKDPSEGAAKEYKKKGEVRRGKFVFDDLSGSEAPAVNPPVVKGRRSR